MGVAEVGKFVEIERRVSIGGEEGRSKGSKEK